MVNEEIRRVVETKKEYFLVRKRTSNKEDLEEYRRMEGVVKRIARETRKTVNQVWTLSTAENFKDNKKQFRKRVNEVRKVESLNMSSVRNSMGEELFLENGTEVRWRECFAQMLNGDEICEVGGDFRRERIGKNERIVKMVVS